VASLVGIGGGRGGDLVIEAPPEDEDDCRLMHHNGKNGVGDEPNKAALMSNSSDGEDAPETPQASSQSGMTLPEFVEHVRTKRRIGLYDEYTEIKNRPPVGTFNHARSFENQIKNRYTDVLCYDHTRVILGEGDGVKMEEEDDGDYINANYVDGYKQPRAFISAQGPLPKTFPDFWQMVWEQRVLVVVMTTKTVERHRTKCGQYWPEDCGGVVEAGPYEIHSEEVENNDDDFVVTHLRLTRAGSGETRRVCHFQFLSWPDYGVPASALSMLNFLRRVREKQAEMTTDLGEVVWGKNRHPLGPPIIVHCSAGIGRTGTFATLDTSIRKFEDVGRVDIRSTVESIRSQRAFSIQMPDQFVFCHLAFLEYVLNMDYVEEIDLTGFDDDCDSE
jgi:tyrosine-protein phosphatase non-receptor type 9